MTDQPQEAGQAPVPDAAPAPDPAPGPGQETPVAPKEPEDPAPRIAALEAELAALRAQAARPGDVLLRLARQPGGPDALIRGGYTIGTSPVPVPQHAVSMLLDAAADTGLTLEEA